MTNDFDREAKVIIDELKQATDYLECEAILLNHLKKQVKKGSTDSSIEIYMKKLLTIFEARIKAAQNRVDCVNDRYAAGFLKTLTSTTYWRIWLKSGNL
jgi:hypothetical protein